MFKIFLLLITSTLVCTSITSCKTVYPLKKPDANAEKMSKPQTEKEKVDAEKTGKEEVKTTKPEKEETKPPKVEKEDPKTPGAEKEDPKTPQSDPKIDKPVSTDPQPVPPPSLKAQVESFPLGIIGEVEPIYVLPINGAFASRIDTGATTSSINAQNVTKFERDGRKWVSFDVTNPVTKEKHTFRKRVISTVDITRAGENEIRYVVMLDIRFGGKLLKRRFTLADRSKFQFPVLVGRNLLAGLAIVDVTRKNTLK